MATVSIEIDGVPVIIKYGSFSMDEWIEERSTASFIVIDTPGTATYVRGTPIEVYDEVPTLVFSGFIDTPERDEIPGGNGLYHAITCMDNHYLADKRLVVKSYTDKTLKYIVEDIWADYLEDEGVTIGEVQVGPTLESVIFNYVKASQAYDELKKISGFTWLINELKELHFIDRTTNAADWQLDGTTNKPIEGSEHLDLGNPLYRNRQYIRGGRGTTVEQTEIFTGDGVTLAFTLGYPLALVPVVTVADRVPELQTIGIKGLSSGLKCYWNKGDATITFDPTDPPENTKAITVAYYGQYPLIVRADRYEAVLARQAIEGGTGLVEDMITEAQHETAAGMRESAEGKLTDYCRDAEKFIYETRKGGLVPGTIQTITHAPFDFATHDMLIERISASADINSIIYEVTCITGPVSGSWARFFSTMLQRQETIVHIGGDFLLVLLAKAESLSLAEVPTDWEQLKAQYCWAVKTNGVGLREARWNFFTWG